MTEVPIWRNTEETSLQGEEWRTCEVAPNYEVSSLGRVRVSIPCSKRNGRHLWLGKIITQNQMSITKRYLRATLTYNGQRFPSGTHRLVGKAFVQGETEERNQINHKDGNPKNNKFENLEWVTCQENKDHAIATGLQWYLDGEDSPHSKLTAKGVALILQRYFFGFEKLKDIGKDFGMRSEYISLIIRGKRWNKVFCTFVEANKEHYERVKDTLRYRNGTNMHKFEQRISEKLFENQ